MVRAHPFRGTRYSARRVGGLAAVTAQATAWSLDTVPDPPRPFGIEHLQGLVPADAPLQTRLAHAVSRRDRFLADGALLDDPVVGIDSYVVRSPRHDPVHGLLVTVDVDDPQLLTHENVLDDTVEQRRLLRTTIRADLSPILGIRATPSGPAGRLATLETVAAPVQSFVTNDGAIHELRRIEDPEAIVAARWDLAETEVLVADGHHRLAAARAHRRTAAPTDRAAAGRILAWITDPDAAPALAATLPGLTLEDVWQAARRRRHLPRKSTRFEPKPRSGVVMRRLDVDVPTTPPPMND